MRRALLFAILVVLGCQPEMSDMMQDGPMDGGRPDTPVGMPDGMMPSEVGVDAEPMDAEVPDADPNALRINEVQMRGTTNSYHAAYEGLPVPPDYDHLPLAEQAGEQGIRFFDFDLNPDRGAAIVLVPQVTAAAFEGDSTCPTWHWCLRDFALWMDANPDHSLVIFVVAESYRFNARPGLQVQLDDLEESIVDNVGRERVFAPADVRGEYATLREAIRERGWPPLEAARGKAMFVLNDREFARDWYIERGGLDRDDKLLFRVGDPDLPDDDEVFFTFEPETIVNGVYVYETDPADLERMQALATDGYLVHGISDDPEMIAALQASGAHFVGTRYPERFGPIPPTGPVVCNPVTGPDDCDAALNEPQP